MNAHLTPDDFFAPTGLIASVKPDFQARLGQQQLSEIILQALEERVSVLVECPTGFGKSFGVLVPSIIATVEQGKRVVISTETLTLQDQYVQKDLPLLQHACARKGVHFNFAVAKGKSNYVCRAKLDEDDYKGSRALHTWAKRQDIEKGDSGDQVSVPFAFNPSEWFDIACDDDCERKACPYFINGRKGPTECFAYESQRKYIEAQVVVANHTLVLLDIGNDPGTIIGPYDMLIVDEAHSLAEKAQDCWGISFKPRTVSRVMHLMNRMLTKVGVNAFEHTATENYRQLEEGVFAPFASVVAEGKNVALKQIKPWIIEASKEAAAVLITELRKVNRDLNEYITRGESDPQTVVIRSAKERIVKLARELASVYGDNINDEWKDNWLVFLETATNNRREAYGILNLKPIEVAPLMRHTLFSAIPTVILMSATMRVGKEFGFMRRELGVPDTALEYIGDSPFNFKENVTGYFPTDLPDNKHPDYLPALAQRILDTLLYRKGAALILFTNISHMRYCHDFVQSCVPYVCLLQGEASRMVIIDKFKQDVSSCLFATKTFFTGIDIPGKALSTLILTKAPFAVPTEPMFSARADRILERGGKPFELLSMPMMLFDVRQGFGRLIRTVSDTGFFAFLDSNAMRKFYGKQIVSSLPGMSIIKQIEGIKPIESVARRTNKMLDLEDD